MPRGLPLSHPVILTPRDDHYPPVLRARDPYPRVVMLGSNALLLRQSVGLICSRRCPGSIVIRMYEFVQKLKLHDCVIAGGFQSPMERECFEVLAAGRTSFILCPARGIDTIRPRGLPGRLLTVGRLAVLSPFPRALRRCTKKLAVMRNRFVASLAAGVIIPHAAHGSETEKLARELLLRGVPLFTFDDPCNSVLLSLGAQRLEHSTLQPGLPPCTS